MTKKMNRLAAKQWADYRREQEQKEADAKRREADLDALRKLRDYLIRHGRDEPAQVLITAIDDYAGHLTGNRETLWSSDARRIVPSGTNRARDA